MRKDCLSSGARETADADDRSMGLQRKDVYICNVVKCRPPENRQPDEDEVSTCSPFLCRQIDAIAPKVIGLPGRSRGKTLLQTNRGISQFRGELAGISRRKFAGDVSPRLFAAQSTREE